MTCTVCRGFFGSDHNKRTCAKRAFRVVAGCASEEAAARALDLFVPGLGSTLSGLDFIYHMLKEARRGTDDSIRNAPRGPEISQ